MKLTGSFLYNKQFDFYFKATKAFAYVKEGQLYAFYSANGVHNTVATTTRILGEKVTLQVGKKVCVNLSNTL